MTNTRGFTILEVLIAIALFVAMSVGVAQLIAIATKAARTSREQTTTVILAAAKMDQLRALDWTYEPAAPEASRSDFTTDVSDPAHGDGGRGLLPSPAGVLLRNQPPYVDYLDASGSWVGNDADPPAGAVFVRRWAVQPWPTDPDRTLVLHVLVTTVGLDRSRGAEAWRSRTSSETLLVSVRTRKGQ
jgi:prepilin-type N-terminal cleavage/methylation domain-containing protein